MSNNELIETLIEIIGDDPKREGLQGTPTRVIKSYRELFSGYRVTESEIKELLSKTFTETNDYDEMIICKGIPFVSFCEHHILPFTGICHVGYIPKKGGHVVGLSKIPRLVDVYAKRLQIQERLTRDIANAFDNIVNPLGIGIVMEAEHQCVSCRGVKKVGSKMITSALLGTFREPEVRQEFLNLIRS